MNKDYIFPCGEKVTTKTDAGHAYGLLVAQKDVGANESTRVWAGNKCKECKLGCTIERRAKYLNRETHKESSKSDFICLGYSQEYLDNKNKPTVSYLDNEHPEGDYVIELTLQAGEYRTVRYMHGITRGCGLLDLVDESALEEFFDEYCNGELGGYNIWMISDEGRVWEIEFDSLRDVINSIASVRLIELNEEAVN